MIRARQPYYNSKRTSLTDLHLKLFNRSTMSRHNPIVKVNESPLSDVVASKQSLHAVAILVQQGRGSYKTMLGIWRINNFLHFRNPDSIKKEKT